MILIAFAALQAKNIQNVVDEKRQVLSNRLLVIFLRSEFQTVSKFLSPRFSFSRRWHSFKKLDRFLTAQNLRLNTLAYRIMLSLGLKIWRYRFFSLYCVLPTVKSFNFRHSGPKNLSITISISLATHLVVDVFSLSKVSFRLI